MQVGNLLVSNKHERDPQSERKVKLWLPAEFGETDIYEKKLKIRMSEFEFGYSAREAEGLPLYRTKQSMCVLSKIRLLICYTFVFQSETHILGEMYKIDINFTLFTFTI